MAKVFDILKITKVEVEIYFASTFYRKPKFPKAKWTTLICTFYTIKYTIKFVFKYNNIVYI